MTIHAARLIGVFLVVACAAATLPAVQAASWSADKARRARAMTEHFLRPSGLAAASRAPALSVAIGRDGALLLADGFGNAGYGEPASAATVYRVGSLTKQFTAAAILRMIEQRAVSPRGGLPITLATGLDDFFEGIEAWHVEDQPPITLGSLLNMTSNLPNFTRRPPAGIDPWGAVHARTLFGELKRLRPSGWPGSFEYSNTSYFILAEVLEAARWPGAVRARAYEAILTSEVFAPARMATTGFIGRPDVKLAAAAYKRRAAFANRDWLMGSGDVTSTVLDIFAWNRALMAGEILTPAMRAEMFREAARVGPTDYYGMGWFISESRGWRRYYHSGSVPGFTAYNAITQRLAGGPWFSVTLLSSGEDVEGLDNLADDLLYLATSD